MATALTTASLDAKALGAALRMVQPFADRHSRRVRLNGTDDALWIQAGSIRHFVQVPVASEGAGELDLTVDAYALRQQLPKAGLTALAHEEGRLVVAHDGGRTTVEAWGLSDWARFSWVEMTENAAFFPVDPRALRSVAVAAASDDTRPLLACVEVRVEGGAVRLTGTDSYRLHTHLGEEVDESLPDVQSNVPTEVLRGLLKGAPSATRAVSMAVAADGYVAIEAERADCVVQALVRAVDGTFPKWESLIPELAHRLIVDAGALAAATAETAKLQGGFATLRLEVEAGAPRVLRLTAENRQGSIERTVDLGAPVEPFPPIGANPGYLAQAAAAMPEGEVWIDRSTPTRPLLLTGGERGELRALVMPIRLHDAGEQG